MSQTCDPRASAAPPCPPSRGSALQAGRAALVAGAAPVTGLIATLWRRYRNRRQITRLLDMDERMLRDLGIERADVQAALYGDHGLDPSVKLSLLRNRAANRARPARRP